MNRYVLNKISKFSDEKTELSEVQIELASLDMVNAMQKDAMNLYKQGQTWAKEMETFTKKTRELNRQAASLLVGLQKELIEFQQQAKSLGLDAIAIPGIKEANNSLGVLDNIVSMTEKFK